MKIIAYTYDADIHCIECTKKQYATPIAAIKYVRTPESQAEELDENGMCLRAIDREGNLVRPIFSTDEQLEVPFCGDCHKMIRS
jgi:hypothetical protein